MFPRSQLGPNRSHRLAAGATVIVKSRFGPAESVSLNTLLSMPALVSATTGLM